MTTYSITSSRPKTLLGSFKQWRTRRILAKLDNARLKDIGVNRWELTSLHAFTGRK